MLPLDSEPALNELLLRKEEEWRALQARRSQLQEAALQDTRSQLEEAQGKLRCLQEDFVYNLQVLEERDLELERYEAAFARAREWEEARRAEVSELKIEAAKLRQALAREARKVEELQQQQQLVWQEHRLELERVHSDKNGEIDHHREQYENLKCRLERKLEELDGELALQRQELLLEFELKMQKREHEFRLQTDNMSNTALSQELKVKLLHKELEVLKEAGAKAAESLQRAEATNAELERKLQSRAAELRDLEAMNCARVKDLEDKLHSVQLTRKKEEETFKRKFLYSANPTFTLESQCPCHRQFHVVKNQGRHEWWEPFCRSVCLMSVCFLALLLHLFPRLAPVRKHSSPLSCLPFIPLLWGQLWGFSKIHAVKSFTPAGRGGSSL
uniref:coiled-coil domain-containing protein 57 isoform X3 n=1 Tax=Macaca mulatta TaxID=9544 RepID=UPI0010A20FA0|nr:coiled-coil domain-containing protein 57 isoform X3 [Macaca mulatta]